MATLTIISTKEDIFYHGNKHMQVKLRAFGDQSRAVIKYILGKMLKYSNGFFESNKTIASEVGCSVRTVQNAIRKAEQLNIFAVSPRKELDELTGKIRQTTNLIQLIAYVPLKNVKKVIVEAVREVKNKAQVVAEMVQEVFAYKKQNKPKTYPYKPQKTPIRKELLPDWFDQKHEEIKKPVQDELSFEEKKRVLEERLANIRGF